MSALPSPIQPITIHTAAVKLPANAIVIIESPKGARIPAPPPWVAGGDEDDPGGDRPLTVLLGAPVTENAVVDAGGGVLLLILLVLMGFGDVGPDSEPPPVMLKEGGLKPF